MNILEKVMRDLQAWVHERFLFNCVCDGYVMEFLEQGEIHIDIIKKAIELSLSYTSDTYKVRIVSVGYNVSGNMFIQFEP